MDELNLKVRKFRRDDEYSTLYKWWYQWGFEPLPLDMLPNIGIMVETEERKICSVFIYQTDSGYCWLNWWLSNKEATKEERKEGLDLLIKSTSEFAKELGFKMAFVTINNNAFEEKLHAADFVTAEKGKKELFKVL